MNNLEKADGEKLKKLGVKTLLDLALIAPKAYEDTFLSAKPLIGEPCVIEALVLGMQKTPKILRVRIFAKNLNANLTATFFAPKPWQEDLFKTGPLFLSGKLTISGGGLELIHPKKLSQINTVLPIYKTRLKNTSVIALMQKYLSVQDLVQEGVSAGVARELFAVHNPSHADYKTDKTRALKYAEIFNYLKKLSAKKPAPKANFAVSASAQGFIGFLPFKLTADQLKAIACAAGDLASPVQRRRVIIGDVGCGKTMVILAIAFMAGAKRSVLMAPTSILARQIYQEARKYLGRLKIALITSSVKEGTLDADFLIGTQALLYQDLPLVAAVMVDEQHRFGTAQRARLKKLTSASGSAPHYFQFSATPIPRTQALIQSTLVGVSLIKQLPFKKDIKTRIVQDADFAGIVSHIRQEIALGHQALVVYPLVEEGARGAYKPLESAKDYWLKNFARVYVTHGKDRQKERVLEEFAARGDILLATTVVEVGISLPRLTTVIIVGVERLGLATLHQLRGRVGRNGLAGHCFLYTKFAPPKRLVELAKTLDGFAVAELDLAQRQAGDVLSGEIQSGKTFEFFDLANDEQILLEAKNALDAINAKKCK